MLKILKDKAPTLKEAQDYVEGYIEVLWLDNGDCLIVNEEGRRLNLPVNNEATLLMRGRIIVGNALLLTGNALAKF